MTGPSSMNEGFDMEALMQQAQAMQNQLAEAQAAAAAQVVEGQAGGGVVKVRLTGDMDFQSVSIDPEAVDPGDLSMLEDLVLAACNDAVSRARSLGQQALGGLDLGSLGLGGTGLGGAGLGGLDPGTPDPGSH
ncbi:MAG: YbaB/EbfC family nucleoid-associated protein [Actinomycetota bacterium]|nr:YbaB/EbfC family nucleoid-associated protein [Actinomycetota bacterium]